MTWIAISDHENHTFSEQGIGARADDPWLLDDSPDALLAKGSLVIETRLPVSHRPRHLVYYANGGDWALHLSLQALPGGGLTLVLEQGGEILHQTINHSEAGRTDVLRITYSWDAPGRWGQLALERSDQDTVLLLPVASPKPLRVADARALMLPNSDRYLAPDVLFLALSDTIEPVGPMPSLSLDTPIATPVGYRAAGDIRRGDLVLTADGQSVPVLHRVNRTVPAAGCFSPVQLRAPYFGLRQEVRVAPSQRLVLSGADVEYLFGQESVLIPAQHLLGGNAVVPAETDRLITYTQLLLPSHETLIAAGMVVESLYIGRLRRKKAQLCASLLAGLDRSTLPEHGRSVFPVLRAFDATVLAEHRAA